MNATFGVIPAVTHPSLWVQVRLWLLDRMKWGMEHHPVLTYAAALIVAGVGMVAAVAAVALTLVVPLALLTGVL